ncbi:MAG TPA: MerR family transcriptional regulator [Candidatus Competibacter sp.]|nr:MerR family transcriptional regulator [Candidatus Competibacteraceae bacterium]HPE70696.1 MerR family transcriptional regulator [Candidatus Competibacter sp.]HRX71271.1 MerR family transcriptional regulator [Candidatus Competibacteraceae bacterium]
MKKSAALTVGELAKAADVHVETVRYYQRRGLLATPERQYGTIRRYTEADLNRLRFIRRAQRLGFTLDEITQLLALDTVRDRDQARALAEIKVADLDARITDLQAMRRVLIERIADCAHGQPAEPCPVLEAFQTDVDVEPEKER